MCACDVRSLFLLGRASANVLFYPTSTPSPRRRVRTSRPTTPSTRHILKAASHAASAQERDHGRQVPLPPAARHEREAAHVRRVLADPLHQRTSGSGGMARPFGHTNIADAARVRGSDGRVPRATYFFGHAREGRAARLRHVRPVHDEHVVGAHVLSCFDAHSRLFEEPIHGVQFMGNVVDRLFTFCL